MVRVVQCLINDWIAICIPTLMALGFCQSTLALQVSGQEAAADADFKHWYVEVDQAEILSGPGDDYYPTGFAKMGDAVQVFERTDEGWLAIRPPEGSFSWVRADDAYLLPGGKVIEIRVQNAVSWIGSELGSAKHYRWQVALNQGEQLAVISESQTTDAKGTPSLWYKIAPPSGEFRWIHESYVSEDPPPLEEMRSEPDRIVSRNAKPISAANSQSILERTEDSRVAEAPSSSMPQEDGSDVELAAYQDDVFGDAPITDENGMVIEPIPQGEVVYEGGAEYASPGFVEPMHGGDHNAPGAGNFAGWSAFELTDDGLQWNFMRRWMGENGPATDPLEHDPFSLEMPQRPRRSQGSGFVEHPPVVYESQGVYSPGPYADGYSGGYGPPMRQRGYRPWRDPYELRNRRLRGYPGLTDTSETPNNLVDSIRQNIGKVRESVGGLGSRMEDRFGNAGESRGLGGSDKVADSRGGYGREGYGADAVDPGYSGSRDRDASTDRTSSDPESIDWYGVGGNANASMQGSLNGSGISYTDPLNELQVAVSDMVARPPGYWDLEPIAQRTQYFIEHGSNPVERGQARLLLDRIRQFQEHARRTAFVPGGGVLRASYQTPSASFGPPSPGLPTSNSPFQTASFQSPVGGSSLGPAANSNQLNWQSRNSLSSQDIAGTQPFDATGYLVPVHSTTPGQPSHAITNENGAVVAYVSALPGMNLDLYLNQPVGITGLRGYLPQLKAGHIQAERIVRLP